MFYLVLSLKTVQKWQLGQNTTGCAIMGARQFGLVGSLLPWLLIHFWPQFKVLVLTLKTLYGLGQRYHMRWSIPWDQLGGYSSTFYWVAFLKIKISLYCLLGKGDWLCSSFPSSQLVMCIWNLSLLLANCVVSACTEAFQSIDMAAHVGVHPRLGAVDLVPIYPLSDVDVEECGMVAQSKWLWRSWF